MTDFKLIIGNKKYSSWSLRPWIFMKYHNIEFTEKRVALFTETTNNELKDYYSDYKVPVLKDGELIVWDTLSIMEYVSEKYLDSKGWPEDEKNRSTARSISAEMHSSFMNLRNELPMNCRKSFNNIKLSNEAEQEVDRVKTLWRYCRREFGAKGEWLFGEYSIADAMYAPIALRFHGYNIPLEGIEADYVNSVLNQPDIINWIKSGKIEKEFIEEDEI